MANVSYKLKDLEKKKTIKIGYVGENNHMHVRIDCEEVFKEYPNAAVTMAITPPEGEDYPKVVTRDGNVVEWTVANSDVAAEGYGEFQMTFTEGEVIRKTVTASFEVIRSIVGNGTAPSGIDDFLTDANAKLAAVDEAIQDAEDAASHAPTIGNDGYWYRWDADQGEYVSTGTKAQGEQGDPGSPGDPTQLIDDTAGEGATGKTWSANKLDETTGLLLNDIQGKPSDVQINGVSIVNNGIANIPFASNSAVGAVKLNNLYGIQAIMNAQGQYDGTIAIRKASDQDIQYGSNELKPIVPKNQHTSLYYALSKLAGVDLANETVTVGQFPNNSLVAIQKMLGIYESPWELIREDTFTNASESDHNISVDGNGNTFELTDAILLFETPVQNNTASKGQYGLFQFFDGDSNIINAYCTAWTQNANAEATGTFISVTKQKGGLYTVSKVEPHKAGNSYMYEYITSGFTGKAQAIFMNDTLKITKVKINSVTGTGHYILYGKRKWN